MSLMDVFKQRRSVYSLCNESTISPDQVRRIVEDVLLSAPTPFNVQSCRIVVLLNGEHRKLWDIASEAFATTVTPQVFDKFKPKLAGLKAAYGSILFYEDEMAYESAKQRMGDRWSLVAGHMPQWAEHSNAMHQYAVWTCLVDEGMGCNLQHYNPLVDRRVSQTWGVPETWTLKAQLVFGKPVNAPEEREVAPVKDRIMFFGGQESAA